MPRAKTDQYYARLFPKSQVAGIVKGKKGQKRKKAQRRLMLLYFFKLTMPENFKPKEYQDIHRLEDETRRAVFMCDSYYQFGYVLYFPKKDHQLDRIDLQFFK